MLSRRGVGHTQKFRGLLGWKGAHIRRPLQEAGVRVATALLRLLGAALRSEKKVSATDAPCVGSPTRGAPGACTEWLLGRPALFRGLPKVEAWATKHQLLRF